MKTNYKSLLTGMLCLLAGIANAQVSAYTFSQSSGTYTPITGGTVIAVATASTAPGNLNGIVWNLPNNTFPFAFMFNGAPYTGCNISSNCYITFGAVAPATNLTAPISGATAYNGAVSAWARNNSGVFALGTNSVTSDLRVEVLGVSPNRVVVIQFSNWRYSSGSTVNAYVINFQIRLSEGSNAIHIVYGPGLMIGGSLTTGGFSSQIGLRGASNTDYNNRTNPANVSFTASTSGTVNTATQAWGITGGSGIGTPGMPPDGLTYRWDPGCAISLTSSAPNSNAPVICSGNSLTLTTNAVSNYTWSNGNTASTSIVVSPTVNTTYSVIGTSTANCVASAAINVIVSQGLPNLAIAASTTQVCPGMSVSLTASGANTYTWTGGVTNGVPFAPNSTASYTVTGENGCGISTAVTSVTVAPMQISGISSPDTVCAGDQTMLSITAAANQFTWQPINATNSTPSLVVTPSVTTIYTVTASDGTCSAVTNLTVTAILQPTITAVASPSSICPGESATLTAIGGLNYTWTPGGGSGSGIVVSPSVSTAYSAEGDNSFGCTNNAGVVVIVGQQPTLSVNSSSAAICAGGTATLSVSGANSYQWAGGPASNNYVVMPGQSTVYSVSGTVTGTGCSNTETISVEVFDPLMSITGNTAICSGATTGFTATAPGEDPNSFIWIPGGVPIQFISGLSPAVTTVYTVSAIANSLNISCPVEGTVQVAVNPNPTVTISGKPPSVCRNQTFTLSASGATGYLWSNPSTTLGTNPTQTLSSPVPAILTISVMGTDALGCNTTTHVSITVSSCTGIDEIGRTDSGISVYPNPNNGTFYIEAAKEKELVIQNELGQVVKRVKPGMENAGKIMVTGLAPGVYFVVDEGSKGIASKIVVVGD